MARRKKQRYQAQSFETTGRTKQGRKATSANIYTDMLLAPAFQDMTKQQRFLYVCMKDQYYGKRKPEQDYPDDERLKGSKLFYFNLDLAVKYGLYTRNGRRQFYNDIHVLEEHGFIKTVSNGRATQSRSIYQYSDEWQKWDDSS